MKSHKHLKLDQTKLSRAKTLSGAKTEQATIEAALDLLIADREFIAVIDSVGGKGKTIEDVFARPSRHERVDRLAPKKSKK
ncbi:hypothetical protein LZC95_02570 [Pendulispora brunnea]|uniref:Uncharacterized protein n=1 Tax=Pendulispora brunnea TaxID=2905690 RepID=A0ABZ2KNV9_9BACT